VERQAASQIPPTRKEGWLRLVNQEPRQRPEQVAIRELQGLAPRAKAEYDNRRYEWLSNLSPLRTPQLQDVHEDLWDTVDSNQHDGDRVKSSAAIDALPGLGKSVIARAFGAEFHRREVALRGSLTAAGDERLPVCYVSLTSNTTMRSLNQMICGFYAHPGSRRGTAPEFATWALNSMLSCETQLIILDDVHFVNMHRKEGMEVNNHFKWLGNDLPATIIFVGVGLRESGFLSEGLAPGPVAMAQMARRCTRLTVDPFKIDSDEGRLQWRRLLLALEQKVVLANSYRGMVADDLSDYLYERSTGHMVSLMNILLKGCARAIRTGEEVLTEDLLNRVKNDEGAEENRKAIAAGLRSGRITTRRVRSTRLASPAGPQRPNWLSRTYVVRPSDVANSRPSNSWRIG
jgi:hypothetical protein